MRGGDKSPPYKKEVFRRKRLTPFGLYIAQDDENKSDAGVRPTEVTSSICAAFAAFMGKRRVTP